MRFGGFCGQFACSRAEADPEIIVWGGPSMTKSKFLGAVGSHLCVEVLIFIPEKKPITLVIVRGGWGSGSPDPIPVPFYGFIHVI